MVRGDAGLIGFVSVLRLHIWLMTFIGVSTVQGPI